MKLKRRKVYHRVCLPVDFASTMFAYLDTEFNLK